MSTVPGVVADAAEPAVPAEAAGRSRPGGRSSRVRAAVHRAVEEMLVEGPADTLTIPGIAARAGVHPTTVYRRWGSLGELLSSVAAGRFTGDVLVPDTGTLRGDLERWVTDVAVDVADPEVVALMRASIGAGTPDGGGACVADRHRQLEVMLDRERARGGVAPDVDRAAEALLGPLYYRVLFTDRAPEPVAADLVAALLAT